MRKRFSIIMIVAVAVTLGTSTGWAEEFALKGEHDQAKGRIAVLEARVAELESLLTALQADMAAAQTGIYDNAAAIAALPTDVTEVWGQINANTSGISALQAKTAYMSVASVPISGVAGPHVIFEGANVHVRSGYGSTGDYTTGLGNLIIGYNEEPSAYTVGRNGAHNLVVGIRNEFSVSGGMVVGYHNVISGPWATVTGGINNIASMFGSSVSGGESNTASNWTSSVSGGYNNSASGQWSSVSGGSTNTASGFSSSVSGGWNHDVFGQFNWAAGSLFEEQ